VIKRRAPTAALLAALWVAVPATAQPNYTNAAAKPVDISTFRIDNFGRVDSSYYRGAQPEGRDYADLAALGVQTIINLTSHDAEADEQAMVEQAGMTYVHIPMTTHEPPSATELAKFLATVTDPANQPVYVHCVGGRHRTGIMTAAYRIAHDGWTSDQAFKEMKQYKFGADWLHAEFKAFVYAYRPAAVPAASLATPNRQ